MYYINGSHATQYLIHVTQLLLEIVHGQRLVGHGSTHAILAEPMRVNPQLAKHAEDGRADMAVAFQLDNDKVVEMTRAAGKQVVEAQVGVDGHPLSAPFVDERDAVEVVVHVGHQRVDVELQVLLEESPFGLVGQIHVAHGDAFLLGAPTVVLRLHLHELQLAVYVGAEAHLLPVYMAVQMVAVHAEVGGVEVSSVVEHVSLAVNLLGVIVGAHHLQQTHQHRHRGNKLDVHAIHQLHRLHVGQGDGVYLGQEIDHGLSICLCACKVR